MLSVTTVSGDIPSFIWLVVGVGLAAALVWFILSRAGAPGWVWTVATIVGAIILLMIVLRVFFP